MNFTFYTPNEIITTTAFRLSYYYGTYSGGSAIVTQTSDFSNLIDRTETVQWYTSLPTLTTTINRYLKITFSASTVFNSIQIKNTNLKYFNFTNIFGGTTFSLSSQCEGTIRSSWLANTATNLIFEFGTTSSESIYLTFFSVTSNDNNIKIGEIIVNEKIFRLPRNPNSGGYDPEYAGQKLEVKTVDGGSVIYNQSSKFNAKIKMDWLDQSTVSNDLKNLYSSVAAFYFAPYPTGTSWQGESFECNWIGNFDLLQNKYNYRGIPYYFGSMQLKETPL